MKSSRARYVASMTSGRNSEIDYPGTRYKSSSAPKQLPAAKYLRVICNFTVQKGILSFVCSGFLCMFIRLLATPKIVLYGFWRSLYPHWSSLARGSVHLVCRVALIHCFTQYSCFLFSCFFSNSTFVDRQPLKHWYRRTWVQLPQFLN
jgi:hypothetical protein